MRLIPALTLCLACLVPHAAFAATPAEKLGTCLADSTTGKDRKDLARWIFVAMASHPDIHELSAVSEEQTTQAHKTMAALVTRLLTETCVAEVRVVMADGGNGSTNLFQAFKTLGEVAMRELMGNRNVTKSVADYTQYLDKKKIEAVLSPK